MAGSGLNNAGTIGMHIEGIRARPEPPNNTPTGCDSLVTGIANMVFSFRKKGNTHPDWGTWGSPFGMLCRCWQSGSVAYLMARAG